MLIMMTIPASPVGHPSASIAAASSQGALGLPQWRADFIASANTSERDQSETSSRLTPSAALGPSRAADAGAPSLAQQLKQKRSTTARTSVPWGMPIPFEPFSFMVGLLQRSSTPAAMVPAAASNAVRSSAGRQRPLRRRATIQKG